MKNIYKIIITVGFLCLFFACHKKQLIKDENLTYIEVDSLKERNLIVENAEKHRFIKLETTENCLIREIVKINFDEDKIFIKDKNQKIFVFNRDGIFLTEIGRIGPGPNDHLDIHDFFLDKTNKQINVFDMLKATIFTYNYSGELLKQRKLDRDIFRDFSIITPVDNKHLILTLDNDRNTFFNFRLVNLEKNTEQSTDFIPYYVIGDISTSFVLSAKIAKSKDVLYLSAFVSDTVYEYNYEQQKILPSIVFSGKYRPLRKEDVAGKTFEVALDVYTITKFKNISEGIRSLYATNKYLHFVFEMNTEIYRCFWDIEHKTGTYCKTENKSMLNNHFSYLISTTDNAFVCAIPAYIALQSDWSENQSAKLAVANTLEDDNPILAFYYLD